RVPRHDFGNPDRRGQAVEEPVARRVVNAEPEFGDLPRRSDDSDRSGRRLPVMRLPDTPTGATDRTPGVALDDDLRRSRIFRGREPRSAEPPPQTSNTTAPRPVTQPTDTQPTGAVTRPEPGSQRNREEPRNQTPEDRPNGRMVRPAMSDGAEKRGRNQ